jgi:hypothetical protein
MPTKTTENPDQAAAGEVVTATSVELVPLPEVREAILTGRVPEVADPDAVSREIAMGLMNATNPEELFATPGTTKPTEILGQNFVLVRVKFMPSAIEEAKCPIYALMDLADHQGNIRTVPCGGQAVVVQCLRAVEENWLPWAVRIVEAGRQREGRNRPLYLETAT